MIRPLLDADVQRIREIDALCFAPDDQYEDAMYDSMLASGRSIVATEDAAVVGYAFVQNRAWEADTHVRSIAVHPSHQRRGHAEALLRSVIESADASVDLLVDESNAVAVRLYSRLGFIPVEMCPIVPPKRRMVLRK